MPKSQL